MNKKLEHTSNYPAWICGSCGIRYGKRPCGKATWHLDTCQICGKYTVVTEPRDFGHLRDGWEKEKEKDNGSI